MITVTLMTMKRNRYASHHQRNVHASSLTFNAQYIHYMVHMNIFRTLTQEAHGIQEHDGEEHRGSYVQSVFYNHVFTCIKQP